MDWDMVLKLFGIVMGAVLFALATVSVMSLWKPDPYEEHERDQP